MAVLVRGLPSTYVPSLGACQIAPAPNGIPGVVWTLAERKLRALPRVEPHIQLVVSPCFLLFIHLIIFEIYSFNDAHSILDCTESNYRI